MGKWQLVRLPEQPLPPIPQERPDRGISFAASFPGDPAEVVDDRDASPLVAGGHLYSFAGNGRVTVLTLGGRPEIVAVNEVGEKVYATPVILDGVIYLRTPTKLFAFKDLQQ